MNLFDMSGKVAIVTGSSRGIGKSIAMRMVEHGAQVVVSSRKIDGCEAVVKEIDAAYGAGKAIAIAASIASKDDLKRLVAETQGRLGPIDVLVCNAASNPYYGPMAGVSDEQFHKVLDNNVLSTHWLVQLVVPAMIERKSGSVILVSSIGGFMGSEVIGAYNVSKAADLQLARNYAVEYGKHNVRVNCICPGLVKTDFAKALWEDPEALKKIEQATPLRRIGDPDDIAGAAVFLGSDASRYMTGQSIVIDGGAIVSTGVLV